MRCVSLKRERAGGPRWGDLLSLKGCALRDHRERGLVVQRCCLKYWGLFGLSKKWSTALLECEFFCSRDQSLSLGTTWNRYFGDDPLKWDRATQMYCWHLNTIRQSAGSYCIMNKTSSLGYYCRGTLKYMLIAFKIFACTWSHRFYHLFSEKFPLMSTVFLIEEGVGWVPGCTQRRGGPTSTPCA